MEESLEVKPVCKDGVPVGWHLKNVFKDDEGKIFRKGKFTGETVPKSETALIDTTEELKPLINESEVLKKIQQLQEENQYFKSKLESFMKESKGITAEDISKGIVAAQNETNGGQSFVEHADFDPNDILDKPSIFTSYGVFFIIADKRLVNGQVEKVPYGTVCKFDFSHAKKSTIGKEEQISNMCTYKCYSRKIKDWLMTHPHFNIHFFLEDLNTPMDIDVRKMSIVAAEYAKLMQISNAQHIIEHAKAYGIKIGGSLNEIIPALAAEKAKEAIKAETLKHETRLQNSFEFIKP